MEQLVKITEKDGKQTVSARELYAKLGFASSVYLRWEKTNIIKNQFAIYGIDYVGINIMSSGKHIKDYALSIDFSNGTIF